MTKLNTDGLHTSVCVRRRECMVSYDRLRLPITYRVHSLLFPNDPKRGSKYTMTLIMIKRLLNE